MNMKKYLVIPFLAVMAFTACKKKENTVSTLVTYSAPTIVVSGAQYYSIPVGGSLPSIAASSYDSFYKESYPVVIDQSTLDNTTPGLYIVTISAKNKYGMKGSTGVYIAVTNVSPSINLEGSYIRLSNLLPAGVTKLANGLYVTDNVGGVASTSSAHVSAFFVQTDDSTIVVPTQSTGVGDIYGTSGKVTMTATDTTFQYILGPSNIWLPSTRVFQKI